MSKNSLPLLRAYWPWFAAVLSGLLLAACFPGGLGCQAAWPGLVWCWMIPLFPAIWRGRKKCYGFAVAYVAGLAFWLVNLKWLWTVSGLGALALAAFLALYFGIWGMICVSVGNPWRNERRADTKKSLSRADKSGGLSGQIDLAVARKQQERRTAQEGLGLFGGALADSLRSLRFALLNASAWVALEWLRGWLFTGFGWNGLGVAFHDTPVLAQSADLVGVTGLAFIPVFFSTVLIQTGARLIQETRQGKLKPRLDFGVAALLLAVQFSYGVWRLNDVSHWQMERVRILLVQNNISQDVKWDPREGEGIIQDYSDATQSAIESLERQSADMMQGQQDQALELKSPDLVVWPESSMPYPLLFAEGNDDYLVYDSIRHMLNEEVRPLGRFTLIAGMNEMEATFTQSRGVPLQGGKMYNSVVAIAPDQSDEENEPKRELGSSIQTYRKLHLVIFGEYIPFVNDLPFLKELFKFSSGADFSGNFHAGTSTEPLTVTVGDREVQLIPSVCFEDTVGRLTRRFVRTQPQIIMNVTNDGWFGKSEAALQHMANARFRTIELRRPMVRCANTGVSGIITVTGSMNDPVTGERQVIEEAAGHHFTQGYHYGHVYAPSHGPWTLYSLAGDWFVWLCMLITAVLMSGPWLKLRS